jgi:glutathione S-transferase
MEEVRNHAIEAGPVEQNRQRAMQLMRKLERHLRNSKSGWLFGSDEPCALDAHLVVFIKRMLDVDRGDLIPEEFQRYAQRAMEGKEWQSIQGVGSTKPTALSS